MKYMILRIVLILIVVSYGFDAFAAKTVKIKLTGTANESIMMTVGKTGRTEMIADFPYILEVPKDEMPIKLKFASEHYLYYDIDVPKNLLILLDMYIW